MRFNTLRLALAAGTALCAIAPAYAQDDASTGSANDIVVTARRTEERLQDVPISITVFNQQQLNNRNITSATDLATFTPSLSANNNFGSDNTTFAIRGFVQDTGTAPSVGTYFGDVVVPRGGTNGQPVGDSASAGDFFDLQNVQVLKGPQGTLFGRNTTGGAVLFVPQRPTDRFEGYVEGGIGNYGMHRGQAVINIPINDTFQIRAGFDHMDRNGFTKNISGIGPRRFNDVDYWAGRVSIVAQLTPDLENYTIISYNHSSNNGALSKLVAASPTQGLFGAFQYGQLLQQQATGNFYSVVNAIPQAGITTEQWQIINNTSWRASDSLTVRNIASYAQLKQYGTNPIFGNQFLVPYNGTVYNTIFEESASPPNLNTADEATITEEFRLEGQTSRFNWQAGAYLELAEPLSLVGSQSAGLSSCADGNGAAFQCTDVLRAFAAQAAGIPVGFIPPIGNINYTVARTSFHDVGLYAQGTYKFNDQFKVTGGIRYTWDHEVVNAIQKFYQLQLPPAYGVTGFTCGQPIATVPNCTTRFYTESKAPTWLIDLDYTPTRDVLVYGKYSRGYRASTIAPTIPVGGTVANPDFTLNYTKPERVDTFEAGVKTSFGGALRGTFNAAGFYNKFNNQQIQVGFLPLPGSPFPQNAAPVNAGKSTIYGVEADAAITPFEGLTLTGAYTYLHTRIDKVLPLPTNIYYETQNSFQVGDPEALSPRNKFIVGATYVLPLPDSFGKLSIGGSVTYRSKELTNYIDRANPDPSIAALSTLPSLTLVDANLNWAGVGGLPIDATFFVTNLTKQKYYVYIAGLGSDTLGFDNGTVGEPRMFGVRVRYKFGQ